MLDLNLKQNLSLKTNQILLLKILIHIKNLFNVDLHIPLGALQYHHMKMWFNGESLGETFFYHSCNVATKCKHLKVLKN